MGLIESIMEEIRKMGLDLSDGQLFAVEATIKEEVKNYLPVEYLKKGCVNVIEVPVGMMPRQKAEKHIRNFVKSEAAQKAREDGYEMIFMGRSDNFPGTKVTYLEKGKLNVMEICTGMLKEDRAEEYVRKHNEMIKSDERFNDYDILVRGFSSDEEPARFREQE